MCVTAATVISSPATSMCYTVNREDEMQVITHWFASTEVEPFQCEAGAVVLTECYAPKQRPNAKM